MRQSSADRVLLLPRSVRRTLRQLCCCPIWTSAEAIDAVGLIDRILAEFIVEEEYAPAVSASRLGAQAFKNSFLLPPVSGVR